MNIAMFTNTYLPGVGGIEKSIDIFATEMRKQGHAVLVVAPEYEGATESTDTTLRVPAIKQIAGTPYSIKLSVPGVISHRLKQFKPDIIHSHQPFLLGDSALRMARSFNIPIVYTNHTFMERYLHWFPVDWQILRDIAHKLPVAYANLVDHIVTPTASVAAVMRERGTRTAITPIATGIDADFFAAGNRDAFRKEYGIADEHFVLGHLGRLNPEKNLDYLAKVALAFVRAQPQRRRFLLVGEGDSVPAIKKLFTDNGVERQLIYAGLKKGQACADAYAAMDAFAFSSLTDTQGLVLSEAMAAGNPVFALHAPGAQDMIQHQRNGWLFPQQTQPQVFAQQMDAVISDSRQFQAMREHAARDAHAVSIPKCARSMLTLYEQVINGIDANTEEHSFWEKLVNRWEVEIDLVQEKIECLW